MKRLLYILVGLMAIASCQRHTPVRQKVDDTSFCIAVAHTYDSLMPCYREYDKALSENFRKHGLNVSLHHIYMDVAKVCYGPNPMGRLFADSIIAGNYDLLITEGNTGLYPLLYELNNSDEERVPPIVSGGVNVPVWPFLLNSPRLKAIWLDEPDLGRICRMASLLTKRTHIQIELDYGFIEDELRERLHQQLKSPEFVDEVDHQHLYPLIREQREKLLPGRIVVSTISLADPDSNYVKDSPWAGTGLEMTRKALYHCYENPQVVVKRSMFSNEFSDKTNLPQFTVLPYDFGDERTRYLCGYFVPMADQARDVVSSAVDILQQKNGKVRLVNHHAQRAFIDYNALKPWNIDVKDISGSYEILNLPERMKSPLLYLSKMAVIVILAGLLIAIAVTGFFIRKRRQMEKKLLNISPTITHVMGQQTYYFKYREGDPLASMQKWNRDTKSWDTMKVPLSKMMEYASKESLKESELLMHDFFTLGRHTRELHVSFDAGQTYHYWRFRMSVTRDKKNLCEAKGIAVCIDHEKLVSQRRQETEEHVSEMRKKEKFLSSMNHEIRTPLNSVLGFTQVLCSDNAEYSPEERKLFCRTIRKNADHLMELVQEILDFNRIESGRTQVNCVQTLVEDAMSGIFAHWDAKFQGDINDIPSAEHPTLPAFVHQDGQHGLMISVDGTLLMQAFNHLMSNAIKNTPSGEIRCGWNVRLEEEAVEIYVQDTGTGMEQKTAEMIFHLFWKRSSMERGVGLGLPVVERMVKMMNGHVEVDTRLGRGTKMSIVLPIIN